MKPNRLTVRTLGHPADSIGHQMAHMRIWLDDHKIELSAFRPVTIVKGWVAFDAQFCDVRQAERFRAVFGITV